MNDAGYKSKIELGKLDPEGNFVSFKDPWIEMDVCSYSLFRSMDIFGKIQTDLKGGNISFILSRIPPQTILGWAISENKFFSGIIHIEDLHDQPRDRIQFEDAACINLKLNYIQEGGSYFTSEVTLQSENIRLPGTSWIMNYWNNAELRNRNRIEGRQEIIERLNSEISIKGFLFMNNQKYELQSFEMEFSQEIDHKGEPQSRVFGGVANISLYMLPTPEINRWLKNNMAFDGRFVFGDDLVGYELSIDLKQARCIGYHVSIDTFSGEGVTARLCLVAESLSFGNNIVYKCNRF